MASLLDWGKKKLQQAENVASRVVNQVNPLDGGRTYQHPQPTRPQASAVHQITHNGATNFGGAIVKPIVRTSIALNQGIGNAEVGIAHALGKAQNIKTQTAPQFINSSIGQRANKAIDYKGTKRQIIGDAISNVANIGMPGSSKIASGLVGKVAPKIIPKVIPKVVGGAVAGAASGAVGNVGGLVASNQKLTPKAVAQTAATGAKYGAAFGGALPVAAPVAKVAAKGTVQGAKAVNAAQKAASARVTAQEAINAQQKQLQREIEAHVKQRDALPLDNHRAAEVLQRKIDTKQGQIQQLESSRPKTDPIRKVSDKILTAQPGMSMKPVKGNDPLAALKQEALKYKSADEFEKSLNAMKSGTVTGVGHLPIEKINKTQIKALQERGLPHTDTNMKVSDFKPGRQVTQPLEVYSKGPSWVVENGNHRLAQALANGDSHVPVVFKRGEGKAYATQLTDLYNQAHAEAKPTAPVKSTTPKPVSPKPAVKPQLPQSKETGVLSLPDNTPQMLIPEDAPSAGMRVRGLSQTIMDDPNTPDTVKQGINELYKVRNTKDLQSRAANLVKDDPNLALRVFKSDGNSDVGTMIGGELSAHLSRTGQHDLALEVAQQMSRDATHRGQANQALSTWGKLAPESILRFAQRTVDDYNRSAGLAGGRGELRIKPETAKKLTGMSDELQKMPAGREKDIATQKMLNEVKQLIPASWVKKLGTTQTIAQLLNPKTLIRNVVGNTLFNPLEAASQTLATGIDKAASAVKGTPRTTALPQFDAQLKGAIRGTKEQFAETKQNVNLGPETQYDLKDVPTFRKGAMAKVEQTMGIALRVPDRAAFTAAYDDTVKGLMKANKLKQPTQAILDQAEANGLYRTFQDNSKAAQLFTKLKGALNTVGVEGKDGAKFGLGDMILKYPKTPGNLVARGLDYSPVGIVKGMYQIVKPVLTGKPFDQHTFANATARGVVGTGSLMGAGAALGALGIITEKPSSDTDTRNLQKASGLGGYQINVSALKRFFLGGFNSEDAKLKQGDTLVSYDWAQPASIPLSAGAALGKKQSPKDAAVNTVGAVTEGINSLVEQPLVTGVNTFASNIKNKGIVGAFGEAAKGAPASFVPTLSNQARQLTDNTNRNTYSNNAGQQVIQSVENKIPVLSRRVPAGIDPLGNEKQNYQNGSNNVFNVAFNPAFVNKYNPQEGAKLPLGILDKSGETQQMPRTPATTQKVNGTNIKLTPQQNQDFAKFTGTRANQMLTQLSKDPSFQKLSPEEQAKKISANLSDINTAAKIQLLGNNPKTVSKGAKAVLNNKTPTWNDTSLPKGMNGNDIATLKRFEGLKPNEKEAIFTKEPDAEYKLKLAQFERDKKNGTYTQAQLANKQAEVFKAKVGSAFPKEVRDIYGMSKNKLVTYLANNKDGNNLAQAVVAYGDSLAKAGIESNKLVNSKGEVQIIPKGTVIEAKSTRISQAAQKNGIPDNIFAALVRQESGGNQAARSPVGAIGLTQLMPDTARSLGVDPNNPDQNLDGGARYLKQMYDKFGRWDYALAAYNAGPGAVEKYHGIPPYAETQNYVKSILGMVDGGIKGNDINLVLNDPSSSSGGLHQSGVSTASSSKTKTATKQGLAQVVAAAKAGSGIKVPKTGKAPSLATKSRSTAKQPALKQYSVRKPKVSLKQLAKLA